MKVKGICCLFIIAAIFLWPDIIGGQCTTPEEPNYWETRIHMNVSSIVDEDYIINETVIVDADLSIENSTILFSGSGMVISENATLRVSNSTFGTIGGNPGYYIDLLGDAFLKNSWFENCIDGENSFFGLYVEGSRLEAENIEMVNSGMIRNDRGSVNLTGSSINGLLSYSGNISLIGTDVTRSGISQIGPGKVVVKDVNIFTSMPFTSTAGIFCMDSDELNVHGARINGTYNGGISSVRSKTEIIDSVIRLENGTIGLELNDLEISGLRNISSSGTEMGIYLHNCSVRERIENLHIDCTERGMDLMGNNPLELINISIHNANQGMYVRSPASILESKFEDTRVGLIIEDDSVVELDGCDFTGYGLWAIEDETWTDRAWPGNIFNPGPNGLGAVAWWGWTDIGIFDEEGLGIQDSEIFISTPFGTSFQAYSQEVGLVWGYMNEGATVNDLEYLISARWGTARSSITFSPGEGKTARLELPMTDLWVRNLRFRNNTGITTLTSNGSGAKDIEVTLYVDGIEWSTYRTELEAGETIDVAIPLPNLRPGSYHIEVWANSRDEFKGAGGIYIQNNYAEGGLDLNEEKDKKEIKDSGATLVLLLVLTFISFLMLLVPILLKRK
ncbi:MAG: hypothetical protein ACMUIE_00950 [Thermoplasmatota archaeon]